MKSIDEILIEHRIEAESDRNLVRVIGRAAAYPKASRASLLEHSGISMTADLQLASAMVDAIQCAPAPVPAGAGNRELREAANRAANVWRRTPLPDANRGG